MKINSDVARAERIFSTGKFDRLIFLENGIFLKYRNKQQIEIPFKEIAKVYVKKYRFNPFVEFIFISFPFLLIYITIQYFASSFLFLVSIITAPTVLFTMINYKWYRFSIYLKDGTYFSKRVRLGKKTEALIDVGKIQRGCYKLK